MKQAIGLLFLLWIASCGSPGGLYDTGSGGGYTNATPPWHVTYKNQTPETNNSAVPHDPTLYDDNATVTVMGNTGPLVWNDWHLVGWNTKNNGGEAGGGGGEFYALGTGTFQIHANVTLWGQWEPN